MVTVGVVAQNEVVRLEYPIDKNQASLFDGWSYNMTESEAEAKLRKWGDWEEDESLVQTAKRDK